LQDPDGSWARTGPYITALDIGSALLQLPIQIETPVKLDADHSTVVKFDSKTTYGYKTALNYLRAFEKEAPDVVRARFCAYSVHTATPGIRFHMSNDREMKLLARPLHLLEQLSLGTLLVYQMLVYDKFGSMGCLHEQVISHQNCG
jgi:hypothetical protein